MESFWIKNIYYAIKEISDINFQKIAWFGKSNKWVSSYTEMMNSLYDDFNFEDFITHSIWVETDNTELHEELLGLDEMLRNYNAPCKIELIMSDSSWINITLQAKKIMDKWTLSFKKDGVKTYWDE